MEADLIKETGITFEGIICGKLRRYFSWKNFLDFFRVPLGIIQAFFILLHFKPGKIFCKGGYVSFPVAFSGWMLRIPVILHEADVTPGLANRLCARFASQILVAFEESKKNFPQHIKVAVTGNPVRPELGFADKERGLGFADLQKGKPVLLCMGGSLGAEFINMAIFRNLNHLLKHFQIVHICGKGKVPDRHDLETYVDDKNMLVHYHPFSFLKAELKDLYAASDVMVSRAGAIALAEIVFFNKPVLLIPLPGKASRGDQIENAKVFVKHHPGKIIYQENFEDKEFLHLLQELKTLKEVRLKNVPDGVQKDLSATAKIVEILMTIEN